MKEHDIIDTLRKLKGEADAPAHRESLRHALMAMHTSHTGIAALRTTVTYIVMKKFYMPVGALAAVALVAALTFNPTNPELAQAQEAVNRAFTRAVQISPEMRAKIEEKMKADMLKTLEEAKAAPDLRILTKEQFEAESPFTIGKPPAFDWASSTDGKPHAISITHRIGEGEAGQGHLVEGRPVKVISDDVRVFKVKTDGEAGVTAGAVGGVSAGFMGEMKEPVKYLSYTDPRGNKTVLGLDENDTPVFKFAEIKAEDIIKLKDGTIGFPAGQAIEIEAVDVVEE